MLRKKQSPAPPLSFSCQPLARACSICSGLEGSGAKAGLCTGSCSTLFFWRLRFEVLRLLFCCFAFAIRGFRFFSSASCAMPFSRSFLGFGIGRRLLFGSAPLLLGAPQRFSVGVVAPAGRSWKNVNAERVPLVEKAVTAILVVRASGFYHPSSGAFVASPFAVDFVLDSRKLMRSWSSHLAGLP